MAHSEHHTTAQHPENGQAGALPQSDRDVAHMQGHWLLARIGKRVLRPGGEKLTRRMLAEILIAGRDVVEFAPASAAPRG